MSKVGRIRTKYECRRVLNTHLLAVLRRREPDG
jgi:hypothetical protein